MRGGGVGGLICLHELCQNSKRGLQQGGWSLMILEVPSKPSHSMKSKTPLAFFPNGKYRVFFGSWMMAERSHV